MEGWFGVEIRHLATLMAIDSERSFRGAAEKLGYVQSAVSQQLVKLEALVGARLVERSRGHSQVELTHAGRVLLSHADRVLKQLEAAQTDMLAATEGPQGVLRVGACASAATRIMPRALALLANRHPELRIESTDSPSDSPFFDGIQGCDLDVAFAELPLEPGTFEYRRLLSDPCVLLVHWESPWALSERVPDLDEIASLPLVAHPSWRNGALIDGYFEAAGLTPRYSHRSHSSSATQALVAGGLAAAILPKLAVDPHHPDTTAIELNVLPRTALALYWHAERAPHPALPAFVDAVESVCARLLTPGALAAAPPIERPAPASSAVPA